MNFFLFSKPEIVYPAKNLIGGYPGESAFLIGPDPATCLFRIQMDESVFDNIRTDKFRRIKV